jgi:hypothetical protein
VATTLVMGAKDPISAWMTIMAPGYTKVWARHALSVAIGQELNIGNRLEAGSNESQLHRKWY